MSELTPQKPDAQAPTPSVPADSGQLLASPTGADLKAEDAPTRRSRGDILTEGAAGAAQKLAQARTPSQLAWRELRKNRPAMLGLVMLSVLYLTAIFAQFIAPYNPQNRSPNGLDRTAHPPMKLRWREANGTFHKRPFVYLTQGGFTQERDYLYLPDPNQPRVVKWFVKGDAYKLFGLIPMRTHLFGVEDGAFFLLGTDNYGRDFFSRLVCGSQISLSVGLVAITISFSLGLLVGGISGYYGGRVDSIIMRGCEVLMSVPQFYLLLALAAALPADMPPARTYLLIIVILSFVGWAGMARIVRGMVLAVREREYVEAARALGQSDLRLIVRHILPATFTYSIIAATMSVPGYILGEAGLSFLNLGIRDPVPSWGNMLNEAQASILQGRWWNLIPGVMIFITTLAFNFFGDGLRDALDPKSRK